MKNLLIVFGLLLTLTGYSQEILSDSTTRPTRDSRLVLSDVGDGVLNALEKTGNTRVYGTRSFSKVSELRRFTKPRPGVQYWLSEKGKEGWFELDPSDYSSPDNLGTVIVSTNGKRFKRVLKENSINITWFGAVPGAFSNSTQAIHEATKFAEALPTTQNVLIPVGEWYVDSVRVPSRVTLLGLGWRSRIMARPNLAWPVVALRNNLAQNVIIQNLNIHGQKVNQTSHLVVGLNLTSGPNGFDFSDPHISVIDVLVQDTKGDAVQVNTREARLTNVVTRRSSGHGFNITATDNFFTNCTAAESVNGSHGWRVAGSNNHFISCKAFYCGSVGGNSDGWDITNGRNIFAACDAQDNGRNGFTFRASAEQNEGNIQSDSNGGSGIVFDNTSGNVRNNSIHFASISRVGGRYNQLKGVEFVGSGGRNYIVGSASGNTLDVSGTFADNSLNIIARDTTGIQQFGPQSLYTGGGYVGQDGTYNKPQRKVAFQYLHKDDSNNSALSSVDMRLGFRSADRNLTRWAGIRAVRGADFASTVRLDFIVTNAGKADSVATITPNGSWLLGPGLIWNGVDRLQVKGSGTFEGLLKYYADYSTSYTSRSLIDKGYADGRYLQAVKAAASADAATAVGTTYSQAEMQAVLNELRDLKAKMRTAGLLSN